MSFFYLIFIWVELLRGRIYRIIQEAVTQWKFRGIKVHRMDGPATREVCDAARAFSLPLLYDPAGQTDLVELLASQYPDVNFIIPRLGSFADDWRAHLRIIDQMTRYPNVYSDTSGIRRFDYLVQAVQRGGVHKLLLGTDGPWLHPGIELYKVRLLGLPPQQEALILGENLLRLITPQSQQARSNITLQIKH